MSNSNAMTSGRRPVLPANVQWLLDAHAAGHPLWQQALLLLRLPLQLPLIWWIWRVTR